VCVCEREREREREGGREGGREGERESDKEMLRKGGGGREIKRDQESRRGGGYLSGLVRVEVSFKIYTEMRSQLHPSKYFMRILRHINTPI
jgi:hypothetical protein